jgi:hypothetical protein
MQLMPTQRRAVDQRRIGVAVADVYGNETTLVRDLR